MTTTMISFPNFRFAWLNEEETRLSVTFHGKVPTRLEYEGGFAPDGSDVVAVEVEDAGLVDWPTDEEISAEVGVGKDVVFSDAGDDPNFPETIFRATEQQ